MQKYFLWTILIIVSCSSADLELVVEDKSPIAQGSTLSEHLGIETLGGVLTPILESGCQLPCEKSQTFSTAEDNQDQITITLVRGNSKIASKGVNLGKFMISGIAPAPRGEPKIEVIFGVSNGKVWLLASDAAGQSVIQLKRVE